MMMRSPAWPWLVVLAALLPAGCSHNSVVTSGPIVRVRLLANADQVLVTASTSPTIRAASDPNPHILNLPSNTPVQVVLAPDGWRVGNVPVGTGELIFQPAGVGTVKVNGKAYRGRYRLVPVAAGRFDLVNDVDIDSYLKSVLTAELYKDWSPEAYKAQAIVARTYALYIARTGGAGKGWDLFADTRDQAYGGYDQETAVARQAADDTAGIVVAYAPDGKTENARIFKAYFSSCCGGITQSAYDAFGEARIAPLREQNVGALCNVSKKFNWGPIVLKKNELTRRMRTWGARKGHPIANMATIDRLDIQYLNPYGRPIRFLVTDSRGARYTLTSEETRQACSADAGDGPIPWSSFFKPVVEQDQIQLVDGHGFGHGVGFCQYCAEARAERGMAAEDIVLVSYPDAVLIRAY